MGNRKISVTILLIIFAFSLISKSCAQENGDVWTFYYHDEAGLIIKVEAPATTEPGQKINVSISFHCYSENLSISYLYVEIFNFKSGEEKIPIETITCVEEGIGYKPQDNEIHTETSEVQIDKDAWDITYGEISCRWNLPGHDYYIRDEGFTMTYVRNVKMEQLIEQLANKTQDYDNLWQNYTELNQTYWDLKGNQTTGAEVELDNTRVAMIIFIITTMFFAATTVYLIVKKPREYW